MAKNKKEIKIRQMMVNMVPMLDNFMGDFTNLVREILSSDDGEYYNYKRFAADGPTYLVVQVCPDKQSQFINLLSVFCHERNLAFEIPTSSIRSKEKIQEVCARAQRAVDKSQKEADRVDTGNVEKETILKRLNTDLGVLHTLSWILNEEGIGQIAPA